MKKEMYFQLFCYFLFFSCFQANTKRKITPLDLTNSCTSPIEFVINCIRLTKWSNLYITRDQQSFTTVELGKMCLQKYFSNVTWHLMTSWKSILLMHILTTFVVFWSSWIRKWTAVMTKNSPQKNVQTNLGNVEVNKNKTGKNKMVKQAHENK